MGEAALIIPPHRKVGPNGITQRVASFQDFKGIAAPAVSLAGEARLYFDSTASKWKISQNTSAYENLLSLPSFTANRVLHTNAAGNAVVEANNVNILSTGELLVRRSTLLFAGNDVVGIDGANSNSIQRLFFRHPNAGTAARGVFDLINDAGNTGALSLTSTGFTSTSGINANELSIIGSTAISSIGIITLGNDPVRVVTEGVERLNVLPSADNGALVIGAPFAAVGSEILRVNGETRLQKVISASGQPIYQFEETDQAVDDQKWRFQVNAGVFKLETLNGAETVFTPRIEIVRSSGLITFRNGNVGIDNSLGVGSSSFNSKAIFTANGGGTKGEKEAEMSAGQETTYVATLAAADQGMKWFNTTTKKFRGWNGSASVIREADGAQVSDPLAIKADPITSPSQVTSGDLIAFELPNAATKAVLADEVTPINLSLAVNPVLDIHFVVSSAGTGAGNVRFRLLVRYIDNGELTTKAVDETLPRTIGVINTLNEHHTFTVTLDASKISATDHHISFKLERLGADVLDTFDGNIAILDAAQIVFQR